MTTPTVDLRNRFAVDGWEAWDGPNPPVDELGCSWVWQTIDGWFGNVSPRVAPIDNPFGDGVFDTWAVPFGARTITIKGTVLAPTRGLLQAALDKIAGVLTGTNRRGVLEVDEYARDIPLLRMVPVRLAGPTLINRTGPTTAEFSLSLFAATSARYSTVEHSLLLTPYAAGTGRVYNLIPPRHYGAQGADGIGYAVNAGDYSSWPVITFTGGVYPRLTAVGSSFLQLNMDLTVGSQSIVLDSANRTVRQGTSDRRQYLSSDSHWYSFPPGTTKLFFQTQDGNGTAYVTWRDCWA